MAKNVDYRDWKIQLAHTYTGTELKKDEWFSISKKINGIRATFFDNNLISRSGKILKGLNHITEQLRNLYKEVFDGELRLKPEYCIGLSDNEAFKIGTGIANSTINMEEKHKLEFIIFDCINENIFNNEGISETYKKRCTNLLMIKWQIDTFIDYNNLKFVPVLYQGTDQTMIQKLLDQEDAAGLEGIMINRDMPYEFKRSKGLLKYKKFNTIDLTIVDFKEGEGKYVGTLGAIGCLYDDNIVYVGTGLDDLMRDELWKNKEALIGRICEVKYKDITCNKETKLTSLQFPIFVCIREDKIEADK